MEIGSAAADGASVSVASEERLVAGTAVSPASLMARSSVVVDVDSDSDKNAVAAVDVDANTRAGCTVADGAETVDPDVGT
jgi:hypothetical protein